MQIFRQHRGIDPVCEKLSGSVSTFVLSLHPVLRYSRLICWQYKSLVDIKYAKYCSDTQEAKLRKLKELYMLTQTKLAQKAGQSPLGQIRVWIVFPM